jgi:hypothetical protein
MYTQKRVQKSWNNQRTKLNITLKYKQGRKVKHHVKIQARQKLFYQRQLDKSQGLSNQLREELNEAKLKLVALSTEPK